MTTDAKVAWKSEKNHLYGVKDNDMMKKSPGWLNKIWGEEKNVSMHGRLCWRTEVYTIQAGWLEWMKAHKKHVFELIFRCCFACAQIKKYFWKAHRHIRSCDWPPQRYLLTVTWKSLTPVQSIHHLCSFKKIRMK